MGTTHGTNNSGNESVHLSHKAWWLSPFVLIRMPCHEGLVLFRAGGSEFTPGQAQGFHLSGLWKKKGKDLWCLRPNEPKWSEKRNDPWYPLTLFWPCDMNLASSSKCNSAKEDCPWTQRSAWGIESRLAHYLCDLFPSSLIYKCSSVGKKYSPHKHEGLSLNPGNAGKSRMHNMNVYNSCTSTEKRETEAGESLESS